MPTYSHSKIECFRNCPRQYYYRYVVKLDLPDTPRQVALFFGSRCHDALEWLYKQVMTGGVPSKGETLTEFNRLWGNGWGEDIVIQDEGMDEQKYLALGELCVGNYYDAHHPFDDSITIELEQMVRFDLNNEQDIGMVGYIDRLAKDDDGVWHIHDYKTNKRLPTQADMDSNPQLAYYEIGIRQMWPSIKRVELHWHFLRFGETITSTRTAQQLADLRNNALGTIADIDLSGKEEGAFETNETGLCRFCDYQSVCPIMKHEVRVNGLPINAYKNEPGIKLVNALAELKAKKDELKGVFTLQTNEIDDEIEQIQEALLEYATGEGMSVVQGDELEVTIRTSEKAVFPRKTSQLEQYTKFENLLQESPFWDMVSSLDASALRTLWKQPDTLNPELCQILGAFVQVEEETKMGIRGKRS
ncbi:hypothetical protein COB72_00475 [bacterium]|nr:MAG: hypothetical protein COB72_00475 [bacterium]